MLQCATSTYIREGSRFCKIIPLEDTPHGSLVQRELAAARLTERWMQICCNLSVSASPSHLPWKGRLGNCALQWLPL